MTKPTPRIKLPASVRRYILQRDNYQCQSCGKTQQQAKLQIDHIVALAVGGSNDISNVQTLCSSCNQKKKHHFDYRFCRGYD
jgi:5-methylcytosine-specific restriction endonuclease McrA